MTGSFKTGVAYEEDPVRIATRKISHEADLGRKFARGEAGLAISYAEFEDTATKRLKTRRYGGTARTSYELLPKLTGNLAFTAERYDRKDLGSYTRRFLVDSGLSYLLAEGLTVALGYKYTNYFSPGIAVDNKQVNRVILEVRKVL